MPLGWIPGLLAAVLLSASAAAAPKHRGLDQERLRAFQTFNSQVSLGELRRQDVPTRPYSELERAGYFFMSGDESFDSGNAKRTMLRELPSGVTAVVFVEPGASKSDIERRYRGVIPAHRLKVVELPRAGDGFWARDGLPVAVWSQRGGEIAMVDARYFHGFEPDAQIASWFQVDLLQNRYYFEGGNFMTNDAGDCITVDNRLSRSIPTAVFTGVYGCKRVLRLPFEKGIGHVDESVRFLRRNTVVTDSEGYARLLRQEGFDVALLPRAEGDYETYVNSLLVDDTIFVPVYGEETDSEALRVYRSFGLKVVPIETAVLSNDGQGSLHCITMTYPRVPFHQLLGALGAREL